MVPLNEVCLTSGKDGKNNFLFQPNRLANRTVKSSTANFRIADTLYYGQKLNHRSKLQINVWKKTPDITKFPTLVPKYYFYCFSLVWPY